MVLSDSPSATPLWRGCERRLGPRRQVGELAELAMKIVGRRVPIVCDPKRVRPAKSEVRTLLCDAGKAARLTDWQPRVGLEAGLERTAKFIRDHLVLYRPEEYTR